MSHYSPVWTFRTRNFEVCLSVTPETEDPRDHFCDEANVEAILDGRLEWFVARVQVLYRGRVVAEDYLSACAYDSAAEFLKNSYFHDMVREAISEARKTLRDRPYIRAA